ncbi:MAG: hypothetical protein ACLQCU_00595 [Acidimicrobiales bacterium]
MTDFDVEFLEAWFWDAACQIHGPLGAPKFKVYILPPDLPQAAFGRPR